MPPKTATREVHADTEPLFEGTHKGSVSGTLYDPGAMFRSLGANPVLLLHVENVTTGDSGQLSRATDSQVEAGGGAGFPYTFPFTFAEIVTWNPGDVYRIYKTSRKGQHISSMWCDVSRGWAIEDRKDVNREGWRTEDIDIDDRGRKDVFGPGQPEG